MADKSFRNFVNGEFVDAAGGETYDVLDPSTGETYAQAALSREEDLDRAYAAAEAAFPTWGRVTPKERSEAMLKIADALEARADEFVKAECKDTGKPLSLTASEEMP
ncbi:MAG TPA: aldehyde dehydrogenase family protein, partial [Nocardioides sp.]|nr:aldehyde dehydrogenase family protein [Nocardioides sp.]